MSLLNIGLKSVIKPNNKISEFCKAFTEKIYPKYKIEILEDSDFTYYYKQYFPNFEIKFIFHLGRDISSGILLPTIFVQCYLKNNRRKSSIFMTFNPKELDANVFLKILNSNPFFKEFYHYQELLKNWITLDTSYVCFKKTKNNKNEIISPFPLKIIKNEISIIPAIIKYNLENITGSSYDLCLIVIFDIYDFITQEQEEDEIYLLISKIKVATAIRETTTTLTSYNYFLTRKKGNEFYIMIFSTENGDHDIYTDLSDNVKEITIFYTIDGETYEKKIDLNLVSKLSEVSKVFYELRKLEQMIYS